MRRTARARLSPDALCLLTVARRRRLQSAAILALVAAIRRAPGSAECRSALRRARIVGAMP